MINFQKLAMAALAQRGVTVTYCGQKCGICLNHMQSLHILLQTLHL